MNQGVAYESDLLVVKMGIPRENSFPRTTELIQGIDYLVRQALTMGRPMAINLSFGNNYGSHKGDSLLETYIDMVSSTGRLAICTGTGNNGNQPLHEGGTLKQGQAVDAQQRRYSLKESVGKVSAEFAYLYPPGIPIIVPGEQITGQFVRNVRRYMEQGLEVQGLSDTSAETICVAARNEIGQEEYSPAKE